MSEKRLNSKGHSFAACISGGLNVLMSYPLELVRSRFQVQIKTKQYTSTFNALKLIFQKEGLRGLYSGCTLGMVGATLAWGSYMYIYSEMKQRFESKTNVEGKEASLNSTHIAIASLTGGIITQIITNPIWLVKTRLQLNTFTESLSYSYKGPKDAFQKIYQAEGIRGFYRGLIPSLFTTIHGLIQFSVYEKLTYTLTKHTAFDRQNSFMSGYLAFFAGGFSKVCALLITYPFMTIRTRLQAVDKFHYRFSLAVATLIKEEGWLAFYKGIFPSLMRLPIHSACFFLFYEKIKSFIFASDYFTDTITE